MDRKIILALDIGTTAIKVLAFEENSMACLGSVKRELLKFVDDVRVEQDPMELLRTSIDLMQKLVNDYQISVKDISGLGITNQRETTILWNKQTGEPIYPAIVWEDKRTQEWCDSQSNEVRDLINEKTGLELSSYFSATKIKWILDNVECAKDLIEKGDLMFGAVDTWILWNLSKEKSHLTDWTNASRTLLFDTKTKDWSDELLDIFQIPKSILPEIRSSAYDFGNLSKEILGIEIPILGMIGDQQASMFSAQQYCGQEIGCTKITFGTGVFLMQVVEDKELINEPFYPSLAIKSDVSDTVWALEYKIENVGREVDGLLNDPEELRKYLERLTDKVAKIVKQLPIHPVEIIIDGGVTQNKLLHELLSEKIDSKIIELPIYNGTALGVGAVVGVELKNDL